MTTPPECPIEALCRNELTEYLSIANSDEQLILQRARSDVVAQFGNKVQVVISTLVEVLYQSPN